MLCKFSDNRAIDGSAVYNNGNLNITSSKFSDNLAESFKIILNNVSVKKGEDIKICVKLIVGDNVLDAIYNNATLLVDKIKPKESSLAIN